VLAQIDKVRNKKSKVTKTGESKLPPSEHSVDNTHRAMRFQDVRHVASFDSAQAFPRRATAR
jgi:hypothetical protein